ncbi:MAG: hypothetical protein V3T33_04095 [Myxococcota bacterium]
MNRLSAYRVLCGTLGALLCVRGLVFFANFFAFQRPGSTPTIPTGPVGYYFVAFAGCALLGWGGGLLGAARHPLAGRTIGTASALALVLSAFYRIAAWVVGDYHLWLGSLPRVEAALFLLLALAFVWLRPERASTATPTVAVGKEAM